MLNARKVIFVGLFFLFLILIGIAVIQFQKMDALNRQGTTKGNWGSLKGAIGIYYGDNKGKWPMSLDLLVPKYLKVIPEDGVTGSRNVVKNYDGMGGWVYDPKTGDIQPNCRGCSIKSVVPSK